MQIDKTNTLKYRDTKHISKHMKTKLYIETHGEKYLHYYTWLQMYTSLQWIYNYSSRNMDTTVYKNMDEKLNMDTKIYNNTHGYKNIQ